MARIPEDRAATAAEVVAMGLDELAREGARRMLQTALELEVADYLERFRDARDERGWAQVVRNGPAREREVTLGSGTVPVRAPRVNDRRVLDGERQKFSSRILPPYVRRSPRVAEVLPLLYLHGLSSGDFREALSALLGEQAAGLSPAAIIRLTKGTDYVYVWADGVHFNVRLEDDRLCTLVVIGARPDGTKEVIAVEDGYRESTESWLSVLRDLKRRGMRAPLLAVADRALGFWGAVREVWPATQAETCWVHRIANVLDKLPRRLQPRTKRALHAMLYAENRAACLEEIAAFAAEYGAKYPKAVESLTRDQEQLLTHFAFPAEHWGHLRTTNPIESTFATVKLRQRVTKGAGSRTAGLTMAFKLLLMAQARWRRLNAPHLVAQVRAGVRFQDGVRIEREDTADEVKTAA